MIDRFRVLALITVLLHGCAGADQGGASAPVVVLAVAPAAPAVRAAPVVGGSRLTDEQVAAMLAEHDRVRAEVGVGKMTWRPELASYAQEWADQLVADGCAFKHREAGRFGENLFKGTEGAYTVSDAVRSWESEKKDYAGGVLTADNWYPAGHYTQIVWRSTTRVGCASSNCGGDELIVCNYDPPGNVLGRKPY